MIVKPGKLALVVFLFQFWLRGASAAIIILFNQHNMTISATSSSRVLCGLHTKSFAGVVVVSGFGLLTIQPGLLCNSILLVIWENRFVQVLQGQ
jgi:hypothetical protein